MTSAEQHLTSTIIVGAGIGGLTAALALHQRGIPVTVLERATEIRPLGVGINLQPAAVGQLGALGLSESLAAMAVPAREMRYVDSLGTTIWAEPRGLAAGHDHPQLSIHRGALQMLLLAETRERLGPDTVRTGMDVLDLQHTDDGVRLQVHDRATGTTSSLAARTLIGADGLHSVIRTHVGDQPRPLIPSGVQMWRGVTEVPEFLDGRTMVIVNDDSATRLVAYPISVHHANASEVLLNWVLLAARPSTRDPAEAQWDRSGRLEDVAPLVSHWNLGWLDVMDMLTRSSGLLEYPMVDRDPLDSWTQGHVTLLGDAAHLMYPIGANGASQAVLDATTLADQLASDADVPQALRRYDSLRRPQTSEIVLANRQLDSRERTAADEATHVRTASFARMSADYRTAVDRATV